MTKFKEYLRSKGIKLECDYEFLPCNYIEAVTTEVINDCIVVIVYSNCAGAEYAVYNRSGDCSYFNHFDFDAYIEDSRCPSEYIDFLCDMGYDNSEWALAVMRNTYEEHAKIRLAFKHMKAGIMDARTFYKLALRYRFY